MATRFIEEYMAGVSDIVGDEDFDENKILLRSLSYILPLIVKQELTQKQRLCFELFYINNKSQSEIARIMHLSQPTVSRHINSAKDIVTKIANYCFAAVKNANDRWIEELNAESAKR